MEEANRRREKRGLQGATAFIPHSNAGGAHTTHTHTTHKNGMPEDRFFSNISFFLLGLFLLQPLPTSFLLLHHHLDRTDKPFRNMLGL